MNEIALGLGAVQVTVGQVLAAGCCAATALLCGVVLMLAGANRQRELEAASAAGRQRELDGKIVALNAHNAQLNGRVQAMAEMLGSRQAELARVLSERLDSVGHRVGQGLETSARATLDNLSRLNERLAVIDAAQARLAGLTEDIGDLKGILANKQTRGAFGQGRMEAIVRDGLPAGAFMFQPTLSNGTRPDCLIRLPGDSRGLVVDAKFPLESFTALRTATGEDDRKQAGQRVRADFGKHIKDVAERYLIPGETQDLAIVFVPSESIYADLNEHFEDVVQRALRQRIVVLSPSLLMVAVQVMQTLVRDAKMRELAHVIQAEVRHLMGDIGRLRDRVAKLDGHFRQAQEDVAAIVTSAGKVTKRADRIDAMEFEDAAVTPAAAGKLQLAQAVD